MRATRATIDLARLRTNLAAVGAHLRAARNPAQPAPRICLAVKANAYGHGAVPVARAALQAGVSVFGVATVGEGVELREAGIKEPILLFGLPLPEEAPAIASAGLTPLCSDAALGRDLARAAAAAGRTVEVHLKIDTGMERIGCRPREAAAIAEQLRGLTGLRLTGLCTHFARSSEVDQEYSRAQLAAFHDAIAAIPDRDRLLLHTANSGAIVGLPESHLDMVRLGVIAYGYYPGGDLPRPIAVQPVMELATHLVYLKRVPAGTGISYGHTHRTAADTVIATLPAGYADGYPRLLSNRSKVLIRGRRFPVVGRICMDQCLVDLGPRPDADRYDRAVLFGPDPAGPDAAALAAIIGTIPYEITSAISARVPRIYRGEKSINHTLTCNLR
ncbi:MAG: alanine racemase [Spirochaetaceae bacterium]|nr:alanine racemase [Spirochaetaceae bacterium]